MYLRKKMRLYEKTVEKKKFPLKISIMRKSFFSKAYKQRPRGTEDIEHILNEHKTLKRRLGRLENVLCAVTLLSVCKVQESSRNYLALKLCV